MNKKTGICFSKVSLIIFTSFYLALSQMFSNQANIYNVLKIGLYLLIGGIFFGIIRNNFEWKNKKIKIMIVVIYVNQIILLIYSIVFGSKFVLDQTLMIPLLMILIGYNIKFEKKDIIRLTEVYAITTCLVAWYVVIKFGAGNLSSGQYFFRQKNQIGAIIGVAIALCIYCILNLKNKKKKFIVLSILNLIPLFLIRNRATMLGIVILIIGLIYKWMRFKKISIKKKIFLIFIICFIVINTGVLEFVSQAFFKNVDITDINSISADRIDIYVDSYEFLKNNFMFGEFAKESNISNPHNFLLYSLQKNGLILSIGNLMIYFMFLTSMIRGWIFKSLDKISVSNYLMLISFVISLVEYLQPFGPGTTQMLVWFFVGNELRRVYESSRYNYSIAGI